MPCDCVHENLAASTNFLVAAVTSSVAEKTEIQGTEETMSTATQVISAIDCGHVRAGNISEPVTTVLDNAVSEAETKPGFHSLVVVPPCNGLSVNGWPNWRRGQYDELQLRLQHLVAVGNNTVDNWLKGVSSGVDLLSKNVIALHSRLICSRGSGVDDRVYTEASTRRCPSLPSHRLNGIYFETVAQTVSTGIQVSVAVAFIVGVCTGLCTRTTSRT